MDLNKDNIIEFLEENKDFVKRIQIYLFIVILIFLSGYIYFSSIAPKLKKYISITKLTKKYRLIIDKKQETVLDKFKATKTRELMQEEIVDLEKAFFKDKEYNKFWISILPLIVEMGGCEIRSVACKKEQVVGRGIFAQEVIIDIVGDFFSILGVIASLENYEKTIKVLDVDCFKHAMDKGAVKLRANLGMKLLLKR
jgi:hypothetical protein